MIPGEGLRTISTVDLFLTRDAGEPGEAVVSVDIVIILILARSYISKYRMHFAMKKDNHWDHEVFSHRLLRSAPP